MSTAVLIIIILFCLLAVVTFAMFLRAAKKYLEDATNNKSKVASEKKKKVTDDTSDAANYRTIAEGPAKKEEQEEKPAKKAQKHIEKAEEPVEVIEPVSEEMEEEASPVAEPEQAVEEQIVEEEIAEEQEENVVETEEIVPVEEVTEQAVEEVAAENEDVDDVDDADDADDEGDDDADEEIIVAGEGDAFSKLRARKSFVARLTLAPDNTKSYYNDLKKAFLSYKKVSSRISWAYDSINFGRTKLATFNVKGKTLYLYLALDANKYEGTKYAVEGVETKKYSQTPCLYKIKTDRRAKWALDLIADVANEYSVSKGADCTDNFIPEQLTVEQLIEKGLIKFNN